MLLGVLGAAVDYHSSVAYRARHYFAIPWTQLVTTDTIREGVVRVVPIGTPADLVPSLLTRAGIGKDGLSGYYPDETSVGVVRLEYDPHHFALVQTHYGIMLHFEHGLLSDVRVERWLTGL
jgi:hypothetical protein